MARRAVHFAIETGYRAAAAAVVRPRPSPLPRLESAPEPKPRRRWVTPGVALALLAGTLVAYHYSLLSLLSGPRAPLASLTLAVALFPRRRPPGPDIRDRYTDYIIGAALILAAAALLLIAPAQLSLTYWLWRLDLLSLTLFAAGAISVLFDVRTLWRLRLFLLALASPWVLSAAHLQATADIEVAGSLAALAVATAAWKLARRRPSHIRRPDRLRWPLVALSLVVVASAAAAAGDQNLSRFQLLFDRAGLPKVTQQQAGPSMAGWTSQHEASYAWIQRYLGSGARWDRYGYRPTDPRTPSLVLDAIAAPASGNLSAHLLPEFYRLHDARLLDASTTQLEAGVRARIVRYSDPARTSPWTALYWDWPIRSGAGIHYQRIVVSAAGLAQASVSDLVRFSNAFIDASAGATRPR